MQLCWSRLLKYTIAWIMATNVMHKCGITKFSAQAILTYGIEQIALYY